MMLKFLLISIINSTLLFVLVGCSITPSESPTDNIGVISEPQVLDSVESILVLNPLIDIVHHRLFRDPEFVDRAKRKFELELHNDIVSTLSSAGLKSYYCDTGTEIRFKILRLARNLGNMTDEDVFNVVLPANAVMANQLAGKRSVATLLVSEFKGWTKADNLIRKERTTAHLFNVITMGQSKTRVPAESQQRINMYLIDARTGVALWSGSVSGNIGESKEMTGLLLERLTGAITGNFMLPVK